MKVYTLIDITETKQHKNRCTDKLLIDQQSNFMSFFQTLSMRFNPEYIKAPYVTEMTEQERKKIGFGGKYKGTQNVWCFEFGFDREGSEIDTDVLEKDFDLIPMISGLNETISINNNVLRTQDKASKNTVITTE